jgi:hypothetical protein
VERHWLSLGIIDEPEYRPKELRRLGFIPVKLIVPISDSVPATRSSVARVVRVALPAVTADDPSVPVTDRVRTFTLL